MEGRGCSKIGILAPPGYAVIVQGINMARSAKRGTLYILKAEGTDAVKIGFTSLDLSKRVRDLQTGCPHDLKLVASIEGTKGQESEIHETLRDYRIRGEWYDINGLPVGRLVDGAARLSAGGN